MVKGGAISGSPFLVGGEGSVVDFGSVVGGKR